jgi:hypothetical protein
MSIDCGQFSGVNNCRFLKNASAYFSLEEAYAEQEAASEAMALRDFCDKGKNPSEANELSSFSNQAFGAFNKPAGEAKAHHPSK